MATGYLMLKSNVFLLKSTSIPNGIKATCSFHNPPCFLVPPVQILICLSHKTRCWKSMFGWYRHDIYIYLYICVCTYCFSAALCMYIYIYIHVDTYRCSFKPHRSHNWGGATDASGTGGHGAWLGKKYRTIWWLLQCSIKFIDQSISTIRYDL